MFHIYRVLTPSLWIAWLRRIAREQRPGSWVITLNNAAQAAVIEASLDYHRHRCPVQIIMNHEELDITFEFLPCH